MKKKIALLFPGQALQFIGMSKSLLSVGNDLTGKYPVAKAVFREAGDILDFDLLGVCRSGDTLSLKNSEYYQASLLVASVAAFRVYMQEIGQPPDYCLGHSFGEIAALTCAGAMSFRDAVTFIHVNSKESMNGAKKTLAGSMALIARLRRDTVDKICSDFSRPGCLVQVANYNSPDQLIISGHSRGVEEVSRILKSRGAIAIPLKLDLPFHTPLMKPVRDLSEKILSQCEFKDPDYTVISYVHALPYKNREDIMPLLLEGITRGVQWDRCLAYLEKQGVDIVIETGAQTGLKNLATMNIPGIPALTFDSEEGLEYIKEFIHTRHPGYRKEEKRDPVNSQAEDIKKKSRGNQLPVCLTGVKKIDKTDKCLERVAEIWARIFRITEVDVDKNLEDYGADSLSIVYFMGELDHSYPGYITITTLFTYPTIRKLACYIKNRQDGGEPHQEDAPSGDPLDSILDELTAGRLSVEDAARLL